MRLTDLRSPEGSKRKRRRVARGGKLGKTATRGANGQNSRSGPGKGPAFEGGQTPWYKRLPKFRGFNNIFKEEFQIVTLSDLDGITEFDEITPETLYAVGIIKTPDKPVKVLANGQLRKKLNVKVSKFSENARKAIEAAGGKAEVI